MDRQLKIHYAQATRPLEFVGFFTLTIQTDGDTLVIFLALDAYTGYLFNLGWETNQRDETILKKIYYLLEDPVFIEYNTEGFTLVMDDYEHLAEPMSVIVSFSNGNLMFDRSYNTFLFQPVYESINRYLKRRNKRLI